MALESNVKVTKNEISPSAIGKAAEELYAGGFYCCEAVMSAIRDGFGLDLPDSIIEMSSGMAVGVGRSGCMCGAANGGVMALGMFFGRHEQNGPKDPHSVKVMELTHELHDWFRDNNGKHALCCRVLTRGMDMASGEHKAQCIHFTGLCARKTAEIICREMELTNLDEQAAA